VGNDYLKSKDDLIEELEALRGRINDLEHCQAAHERLEDALLQGEEAQRRFSGQLSTLVEITNELSTAESVDALCYDAVHLARGKLGFDHIGIWFRTDNPNTIVGTFGVDEEGKICDERGKRWRVDPNSPEGRVLLSREPLVLEDASLKTSRRGGAVSRGTQVFAAIWDGTQVIGHISTDNRGRARPVTEHQCELLRLFGAAVGYLYTRKRAEEERKNLILELKDALANIKTLKGMLPICAHCKKIRDDKGYWNRIEKYIEDHSQAEFSHGLCPDCRKELYPSLPSVEDIP